MARISNIITLRVDIAGWLRVGFRGAWSSSLFGRWGQTPPPPPPPPNFWTMMSTYEWSSCNSILSFYSLPFSVSFFSPLAHWDREWASLNMVLCVYIHMQVSAKMSVCVDTLNTTTTTKHHHLTTTTACEPLTVFIMNNLTFCQLALKSEPTGSYFDKMAKKMRQASLLDAWSSGKRQTVRVQPEIILED